MKKISLGLSDFKGLISEGFYFVDKSLFIKEIIEDPSKVILLPRPRRFGKTLNMSMLRHFYAKTDKPTGFLFNDLKISKYEHIMDMQGKYPVIYLTFKDEKYSCFEDFKKGIISLIGSLYNENKYLLLDDTLDEYQKKSFINILSTKADLVDISRSLKDLSMHLSRYHNTKVVILIDEYDVPIQSGFLNDYYKDVIEFIRNLLSGGLKDNDYLEKAVLTGILRISKESMFSGLNNIQVYSLLTKPYSSCFGFTESEVVDLLRDFESSFKIDEIKSWYNGYTWGNQVIYNPWSILSSIKNETDPLRPYWVNTSSNDLVKLLLTKGTTDVKKDLELLINGHEIVKVINEDIVMNEIQRDTESLWSFLLFSGYLKVVQMEFKKGKTYCNLKIPNLEVAYLYEDIIMSWFRESINNDNFNLMLKSLITGDLDTFEDILSQFVLKTVSYFDAGNENENFYHAFVLGMLIALEDTYEIKSNVESGFGRYDVSIIPKDPSKLGIIIEFKKVNKKKKETLETSVKLALEQISNKNYRQTLLDRNIHNIIEIGIAFSGKELLVDSNSFP